ncbi:hypothetical protein D9757_007138 [Collybiopsis confluens]|uniref:FAD/NAD(P)-binding domain-containing protein n=1 Tax=Collybiopsis confluens TaxID=2823264 RepID=A0A8H5HCK0_9AGAR|nr:hypothetical protein D9757_007138 [Collybiopsis confluens]
MFIKPTTTFRDLAAANPNMTETELLNAANPQSEPSAENDVTIVGGGIHGLMYAIHARKVHPEANLNISLFEKAPRPQWKIGESTLPHFAQWTKSAGMQAEYLLRFFGLHNGLEFFFLDREKPDEYTAFCNNGPPPFLAPGYQLQRSMSELVFTVFAQRHGVNVWHGHAADIQNTSLSANGDAVPIIRQSDKKQTIVAKSPLVIDGTGRFRQLASKAARVKRFENFNTDAFFGYFEAINEDAIPEELEGFEGGHTSHICFPEGWMYLIRMLSWHGSPMASLLDMINYILDHAELGTPHDEMPSSQELCEMFGCQMKWIWSIGYACRDDTTYPADLASYGSSEGERRFNFITKKYKKLGDVMRHFALLPDYHGPGTSWYIRKQLTYQSQVVSGPGWVTIGDGTGFTNPLLSPGINAGMASTTFAAELTLASLKADSEEQRRAIWKKYDDYCAGAVPSLNLMNQFLYLTFMHPHIGPRVGFLWTIVIGHALPKYSLPKTAFTIDLKNFPEYATHWLWGSQVDDWVKVAEYTVKKLMPLNLDEPVPQDIVDDVINFSEKVKDEALAAGKYQGFPFRYEGELRNFGPMLEWDEEKYRSQDRFHTQCRECRTWLPSRGDWRKCSACGVRRPLEDCEIQWNPAPDDYELNKFAMIAPNPKSVGAVLEEWIKKREMDCHCNPMPMESSMGMEKAM